MAVFVRLALQGHPYYFLVDAGAGRTIIDVRVARKLGLRDDGSRRRFLTLGCKVSAQPVAVRSWRLGNAYLPASTLFTQRLRIPRRFSGLAIGGLLGSDFLSRYGTVTIDYVHRQLILGGKAPMGGRAVPITVLRHAGGVEATTQVQLDNHRARFLIDTGAAISVIDSEAAAHLGLRAGGPSTTVTGAVCASALTPVLVHNWSIAGLHFAQSIIGRAPHVVPQRALDDGIVGIIGSATLARRGTLTIDYAHSRMILGGKLQ